ncbi:ABC-type phosphate/phosphonate transport system, periplasmic component [Rivularia sp. PCC 7116]|uniref:phosphate/phosphite/phosphonate ABC transporter substrate-binding protein n=1 Tax=Rivularia sp. PCC 7116 TaxID=373994 RepID=UPI00029EDAF9|nr:PhnD/SsuA/transferrin family substrate-binding protein [Rivularia sp. PCC 7116]AFY56915.1 ABC-type phosphate/phosphonate transport system, periplasmic component [Rivularia sp. PCC 7116]
MKSKLSRRIFISQMLFAIAACTTGGPINRRLAIGVIGYGQGKQTIEKFKDFRQYLSEKMKTMIELEPAFNERIAIERMKRRSWSLVFSTPGLAAIGIDKHQYWPMFPLQLGINSRSVIVVNQGSGLNKLQDLQGKRLALGQQGSATGYYFPLFNLYGLTLASVKFAASPLSALELLSAGEVDAAALSSTEFNTYERELNSSRFQILFTDSHQVPPGSLLCSPLVERKRADLIRNYLKQAPTSLIQETRYIPNASPPDYKYMISVVNRVNSIAQNIDSKPVRLFN